MINYQVGKFADEYLSEVTLAPIYGKTRDQCFDAAVAAFDYPCLEIIEQCRFVLDEILSSNDISTLPKASIADLRQIVEDRALDFILTELMKAELLVLYDSDPVFSKARQLLRFRFENDYFVTLANDDDIFDI